MTEGASAKKWLTVIPAMFTEEYDSLFERWREANKELLSTTDLDQKLVVDLIRGSGGKGMRRLRVPWE